MGRLEYFHQNLPQLFQPSVAKPILELPFEPHEDLVGNARGLVPFGGEMDALCPAIEGVGAPLYIVQLFELVDQCADRLRGEPRALGDIGKPEPILDLELFQDVAVGRACVPRPGGGDSPEDGGSERVVGATQQAHGRELVEWNARHRFPIAP